MPTIEQIKKALADEIRRIEPNPITADKAVFRLNFLTEAELRRLFQTIKP